MLRNGSVLKKVCMFVLLACMIVVSSGCGIHGTSNARSTMPKPVVDQHMQLLWGHDIKQAALRLIGNSHHKVYLDMYELSDPDIISALSKAHARKVDVRVVLDATEKHSTDTGYPKLRAAGIEVRKIHIQRGIDHVKMLIADNGVLIGGMNYGSYSWNNNDASVLIAHPNPSYKALFLWDFSRANGQSATAPIAQLPLTYDRSIGPAVIDAVRRAQHTVDMEAFDLSDRDLVNALQTDISRHISIEILVDPTEYYSKSAVNTLRTEGATVRYYQPYSGELLHAKIVDVDHGSTFIIGSANFSHQAYTYNHEADVVLHNVTHFDRAFRQNLRQQIARGSDYPRKRSKQSWG